MNVVDIMTADPITIAASKTLRDALEEMDKHQIKHLPVVSYEGHVVGIVSDRDCRYALNSPFVTRDYWEAEARRIEKLNLRSIMTPAPIIVEPNMLASEAARMMLQHRIGCLPVMRAETLIGIVTRSDVLFAFMNLQHHYEAMLRPNVKISSK